VLVSATPVGDPRALSGVTLAFRDVTRSRRMEGFKGDLVAAAAHELRTPLTSLHMAVHLCLEEAAGPISDRQRDLLAAARQDCERLQSVVDELLEMARLESGAARLAPTAAIASDLVRDAIARHTADAGRRGCELAMVSGDRTLAVRADASRLGHVFDNLIANALRHAGDGGRIEIGFEARGDTVQFVVDDAGAGVPEHLRDRVFTKFFRVPGTDKQGTGLGLSIVQDVVRAHGGEVGVEASPLGGARFWFTIPAGVDSAGAGHDSRSPSISS
jgi:signal transduction histidine kinase